MSRAPLIALLLSLAVPSLASAQEPPPGAMEHFQRGLSLHDAGDHEAALEELRVSFEMYPSPNSHLYIARALSALGRLAEAVEALEATLSEARGRVAADTRFRETVLAAATELAALEPRVGRLVLRGELPASARIALGARELRPGDVGRSIPVAPGRVTITVEAAGHARLTREVDVGAGQTERIELRLEEESDAPSGEGVAPARAAPTSESDGDVPQIIGGISIGIGLAAIVAGSVLGVLSREQFEQLEETCGRFGCPPGHEGEVELGRASEISGWTLIAGGGAIALGGLVALLVGVLDDGSRAADASVSIVPTHGGLVLALEAGL
jgi:hypothetical protein